MIHSRLQDCSICRHTLGVLAVFVFMTVVFLQPSGFIRQLAMPAAYIWLLSPISFIPGMLLGLVVWSIITYLLIAVVGPRAVERVLR